MDKGEGFFQKTYKLVKSRTIKEAGFARRDRLYPDGGGQAFGGGIWDFNFFPPQRDFWGIPDKQCSGDYDPGKQENSR